MDTKFVGRREDGEKIWLYDRKSTARGAQVRDVRWGDFLRVVEQTDDGWTKIKWGNRSFFILTENIVDSRPLEIIFVDVGQGDGCILVSPEAGDEEKVMIVDAGEQSNMFRFVKWRFGKLKTEFLFHAAVITHPDKDHYQGFSALFRHRNARFEHVFHNGIAERKGDDRFGPTSASGIFLEDIIVKNEDLEALYSDEDVRGRMPYPNLMHTALASDRVANVSMLSAKHGTRHANRTWVPGFAPSDGGVCIIEVLGPVPDIKDGKPRLRWFGNFIGSTAHNEGKTKNGHSILLRLTIGGCRILLGGDLNRPAEDFLLRHYSGTPRTKPLADAVPKASERLEADILKCCHHGAADVTDEFLQSVRPFAFVVSSGDQESHAHPRPELLGRLGKQGRGDQPMILCTEILRSTRERGKAEDFARLRTLNDAIGDPQTSQEERKDLLKERENLLKHIEKRNVGVYGAITLRTDGEHMEISFRLEKPRGKQLWQSYHFDHLGEGEWELNEDGH